MPQMSTIEALITQVEAGDHAAALETFYTTDCSMQENQEAPRVGRDGNVARERQVMARAGKIHSRCIRPVLVAGDHVVIRWFFRFEWLDGTVTEMEELAYQRWQGEQIAHETFFYDPIQRQRRPRAE